MFDLNMSSVFCCGLVHILAPIALNWGHHFALLKWFFWRESQWQTDRYRALPHKSRIRPICLHRNQRNESAWASCVVICRGHINHIEWKINKHNQHQQQITTSIAPKGQQKRVALCCRRWLACLAIIHAISSINCYNIWPQRLVDGLQ